MHVKAAAVHVIHEKAAAVHVIHEKAAAVHVIHEKAAAVRGRTRETADRRDGRLQRTGPAGLGRSAGPGHRCVRDSGGPFEFELVAAVSPCCGTL